jgi:hypothetical protein
LFSFRYPFQPYRKNAVFDDDEDEFIDINDDVEDEAVEAEQIFDRIQLDDNNQSNINSNVNMTPDVDILSPAVPTAVLDEDEFISDDEDLNSSSPDLSALTDNEKKPILEALYKTQTLLIRIRKLVKTTRNICAIDQYVRNHPDGPDNGFIIDIRVSSTFLILEY